MQDVEEKLYKLGIPAKTRHNEVAPGQFEIAPIFEAANVAADHQQLLMTVLRNTAKKHGFVCLLHEKPFAGINGSGKHVNWSVGNKTQGNLLDPGDDPHSNLQFLTFCGAVIRGVHKYGPLLRAAIATASNDHRLGANEAPPAIMSVYLGSQIADVFEQIQKGDLKGSLSKGVMNMGVETLPLLPTDAGDRNRTSPFAFTGNRFEFRAVGSHQAVSGPLVVMNTILADSLSWMADQLDAAKAGGASTNDAVMKVLKEVMEKHGVAVFNGNGYSEEWHKLAAERGLANLRTTADALPVLKESYIEELFAKQGVLSSAELASRFEAYSEQYINTIEVEARLVVTIAKTAIYPAASRHLADLAATAGRMKDIGMEFDKTAISKVSELMKSLLVSVDKVAAATGSHDFATIEEHMQHCSKVVRPAMDEVRQYADALEAEVADDIWPLPTYQEMLFIK
jgi:glutamine synthetase